MGATVRSVSGLGDRSAFGLPDEIGAVIVRWHGSAGIFFFADRRRIHLKYKLNSVLIAVVPVFIHVFRRSAVECCLEATRKICVTVESRVGGDF